MAWNQKSCFTSMLHAKSMVTVVQEPPMLPKRLLQANARSWPLAPHSIRSEQEQHDFPPLATYRGNAVASLDFWLELCKGLWTTFSLLDHLFWSPDLLFFQSTCKQTVHTFKPQAVNCGSAAFHFKNVVSGNSIQVCLFVFQKHIEHTT